MKKRHLSYWAVAGVFPASRCGLKRHKALFLWAALLMPVLCSRAVFLDRTAALAPGLEDGKAAWGDYNNDGCVDLLGGGVVWRNEDGASFSPIGSFGDGIWADCDNDDYLDFYCYGTGELYRNAGSGESAWSVDVGFPSLSMEVSLGANWADHDNDGYVDLYATGYESWDGVYTYYDSIVRNQSGSFSVTADVNYHPCRGGATACDFDQDGDQDIFVSNYRLEENVLWNNDGSGSFADDVLALNADEPEAWHGYPGAHTIGTSWGDLDNDGYFDIFVANFALDKTYWPRQPESQFLRNRGPGNVYHFEDKRSVAGLAYQESYGSPTLGDYDNDGDLDLFLTTIYATMTPDSDPPGEGAPNNPVLYRNDGDWNFTDVTAAEGLDGLGSTFQAAWADFDNDGDLDLVTDGKLFVNNENDAGTNHWLKVKLVGDGTHVNTAAIGAQVRIDLGGGRIVTRQVEGSTGAGNQNDMTLHFGLGSHSEPLTLEISVAGTSWTNGNVAVDQTLAYRLPGAARVVWQEVNVSGGGSVDLADGWYDVGTNLDITATPSAGHQFIMWTGAGVPPGHEFDNPLSITMDPDLHISAIFLDDTMINTLNYTETFESYGHGFVISSVNGWSSGAYGSGFITTNSVSIQSLDDYSEACGYPVSSASHAKVLEANGSVTNQFHMDANQIVWADHMLLSQHGLLTTDPDILAGAQVAVGFNQEDHPAVWYYDLAAGSNRWAVIDDVTVPKGEWIRLTCMLDYQTDDLVNGVRYFQIRFDGILATNAAAWTTNDGSGTMGGGWFAMPGGSDKMNQLILGDHGVKIDDLVVTTNNPLARDVVVVSAHGQADPAVGTNTYTYGDSLSLSITNSPFSQGTNQFVCTAWNMTGHDPASGSGTSVAITLTNNLSLAWLWSTNNSLAPMGTPEWWLALHGLTNGTSAEEELLDGDNDGRLAWMEWAADTIPTDSNSVLKITGIDSAEPGMQVHWSGGVQATQQLERCTNLVVGSWVPVFTNVPPTPITNSFSDSSTTNPQGFFRFKAWR